MGWNPAVIVLGMSLIAVLPLVASAQRACTYLDDEKPKRGLPFSNGTVLAEKVQIDHAQRSHLITVFSDTAQKQKARFDQCFRYEVESQDQVRNFSWPLAGLRIDPLLPGLANRRSRTVVYQISQDPQQSVTRVFAFENASANAKAWAPVAQAGSQTPPKSAQDGSNPKLIATAPDSIIPGLSQFLQQRGVPSSALFAYYADESSSGSYSLQESYSGPGFKIQVRSQAARKGDRVVLMTEVVASGTESEKARYAMPALRALRQIDGPVSKLESYERFAKAFEQAGQELESHQAKWIFTREFALSDLINGALFRVRHPIVIDRNGQRDCVLTANYSPLAMNFGLQDCPHFAR